LFLAFLYFAVNDMSKEHGGLLLPEDVKDDEVVTRVRKEAKVRYQHFRTLSSTGSGPGISESSKEIK
jgi:hypothetical protein